VGPGRGLGQLGAETDRGVPLMIIWVHRPGPGLGRGLGLATLLPYRGLTGPVP
jgi:hypothetical protein